MKISRKETESKNIKWTKWNNQQLTEINNCWSTVWWIILRQILQHTERPKCHKHFYKCRTNKKFISPIKSIVAPSCTVTADTEAPRSRRRWTVSTCPFSAAIWRAVMPPSAGLLIIAWRLMKSKENQIYSSNNTVIYSKISLTRTTLHQTLKQIWYF